MSDSKGDKTNEKVEKTTDKTEKIEKVENKDQKGDNYEKPKSLRQSVSKQSKREKDKGDKPKKSGRSLKRNRDKSSKSKTNVIDRKPLEEFVNIMEQWQKFARGESLGSNAPAKADPHTFVEIAGTAINKFVQNNNVQKTQENDMIEVIQSVLQVVIEQRSKAQEELMHHNTALRASLSISQTVRQFLQVFVSFYHTLASDQPFFADSEGISTETLLKSVYETLGEDLGWTLKEEREVYNTLPIKGDFPPTDYRNSNFEEFESKFLPELARPAYEKLHTLPSLLKRFEGEYAFRTSFISVPDVDALSLLNKGKVPPNIQAGDLRNSLATHVANEYSKIYGIEWKGGNLFAASRAALCFLLHAQTILDVFAKIPTFKPLIESSTKATHDAKHSLDLLKNLSIASSQLGTKIVQPGSDLQFVRKRSSMMNYDNNKTIFDMFKEIDDKKMLQCHPRTDLVHTLIAMFFDSPFVSFKNDLEKITRDLQLTQPAFFSSSLHFAPLFMHQDFEFLSEYFTRNPTSEYAQAFLAASVKLKEEKNKERDDKVDTVSKPGTSTLLFTKAGNGLAPPLTLSPHKYSTENASLFRQLSDNSHKVAEVIHQLGSLDSLERAQLLSSLLRQSTGPDIVSSIQSSSDPSEYEEKSINYVNRRNLSGGIFEMLRATLRSISSYAYPYYHQYAITSHSHEIAGRFASLLLGYSHAYAEPERPKDKLFLDIDYIIPFLYRNRNAILDPSKHRTQILGVEFEFFKSPLVQLVFKAARATIRTEFSPTKIEEIPTMSKEINKDKDKRHVSSKNVIGQPPIQMSQPKLSISEKRVKNEDDRGMDAQTIISNLYALWEESKLENHSTYDLNNFIIKLLSNSRYDQAQIRKSIKEKVDNADAEVKFWVNVEKQLESLSNFIGKYGSLLADQNRLLPESLCPLAPKSRESIEEPQLPAEIY